MNNDSGSEAESFSEEEDENFTPQQEGMYKFFHAFLACLTCFLRLRS